MFLTPRSRRVSIGTSVPYQSEDFPEGFINVQPAGLFGVLRWDDAYDSSGNFAPMRSCSRTRLF